MSLLLSRPHPGTAPLPSAVVTVLIAGLCALVAACTADSGAPAERIPTAGNGGAGGRASGASTGGASGASTGGTGGSAPADADVRPVDMGVGAADRPAADASPADLSYDLSDSGEVAGDAGPRGDAALVTTGPNLFVNAGFSGSLMGWQTLIEKGGDTITYQADGGDGAALIHGGDGDEAERKIHLFQAQRTNGKPYVVGFDLRRIGGMNSRPVQVFCEQSEAPHMVYATLTCPVTRVRSSCAVACTPPADTLVKFGVQGGQSNLDFYVDNGSLKQ